MMEAVDSHLLVICHQHVLWIKSLIKGWLNGVKDC
jgi:hypothetical protein